MYLFNLVLATILTCVILSVTAILFAVGFTQSIEQAFTTAVGFYGLIFAVVVWRKLQY